MWSNRKFHSDDSFPVLLASHTKAIAYPEQPERVSVEYATPLNLLISFVASYWSW